MRLEAKGNVTPASLLQEGEKHRLDVAIRRAVEGEE